MKKTPAISEMIAGFILEIQEVRYINFFTSALNKSPRSL